MKTKINVQKITTKEMNRSTLNRFTHFSHTQGNSQVSRTSQNASRVGIFLNSGGSVFHRAALSQKCKMTFSNQWKSEYAASIGSDVKERSSPSDNSHSYHEDFKDELQVESQL